MADTGLVRRDGVELIRTGTWRISTGEWNASREDLIAAVGALSCPAVRPPVLKIGHTDKRFAAEVGDGEPALGWVDGMRLADGGHTLIGDYTGMPPWLGKVLASAYPDRSVEGTYNFRCQVGHTHPFVLTAVALLGVTPPGVGVLKSLRDVQSLYELAASTEPADGEVRVAATVTGDGVMVALVPTEADAARLAVEGGEPADELHVTLAYLGEAAGLGVAARQDLIDAVSSAVNGMPVVRGDVFSAAVFNPGTDSTCLVLGVGGGDLDGAHHLITEAVDDIAAPEQHAPWVAHMTVLYSADVSRLAELTDRMGPVVFDRVRIAVAGQRVDIPLLPEQPDTTDDDGDDVAAAADTNALERYWKHGEGRARWVGHAHPWTALYRNLRKHVGSERAKRIASQWFHDVFGYWPGHRKGKNPVGPG